MYICNWLQIYLCVFYTVIDLFFQTWVKIKLSTLLGIAICFTLEVHYDNGLRYLILLYFVFKETTSTNELLAAAGSKSLFDLNREGTYCSSTILFLDIYSLPLLKYWNLGNGDIAISTVHSTTLVYAAKEKATQSSNMLNWLWDCCM